MAITAVPGQLLTAEEWDALFGQHGRMPETQKPAIRPPTDEEREKASLAREDDPGFRQRPIYRYILADGTTVEARTAANGQDWEIVDYKPSKAAAAAQAQEARQTAANDPNDPKNRHEAALQAQREKNANLPLDQDPMYETDEARAKRAADRIKEQGAAAQAEQAKKDADAARPGTKIGSRTETKDGKKVTIETWRLPNGKEEERTTSETVDPDVKVERVPINGEQWTRTTTVTPDGQTKIIWKDPSGREMPEPPKVAPDNPSSAAPRIPNFVLGGSQAALSDYHQKLQEGVVAKLWTQKWANERWAEAVETAKLANEDYATQQREIESTRAAEINMATTRAQLNQSGLFGALEWATKINGLLPEGSTLGGEAFAAILGLQLYMQNRSGINSIDPRGRGRPIQNGAPGAPSQAEQRPPMEITLGDIKNPQAIKAKREQVTADIVGSLAEPPFVQKPDVSAEPPAPAPAAVPADGALPLWTPAAQGGIPDAATAPPPAAPVADAQAAADAGPVPGQDPTPSAPSNPGYTPPSSPPAPAGQEQAPQSYAGNPLQNKGYDPYPVLNAYQAPQLPSPLPMTPSLSEPSAQQPWSVMNAYGPQGVTGQTGAPEQPQAYPAPLETQARMKAPWQMTPSELQSYLDAGVSEEAVWSVPGRRVA